MLTFESPFYEIEDVVIFRDHVSPTLFHYLAGPPRLTRDDSGKKHLLLLKYRHALEATGTPKLRDQLGGGFLMLGVDCGLDEAKKRKIAGKLQAYVPEGVTDEVSLVPVLYTQGRVSILALDSATAPTTTGTDGDGGATTPGTESSATPAATPGTFVQKVLGTATPSLLQDERAIFSLSLSPDAVTLLEDAYSSDLSPIGVMYELKFTGLRPAVAVKATADLARCQDTLELAAKAKVYFLQADIQDVTEKMIENGDVKIEIVREQTGATVDAIQQAALTLLQESILKQFFQPAMSQQPQPSISDIATAVRNMNATTTNTNQTQAGNQQQQQNFQIAFSFTAKHREELKTVTFDYTVSAPEERTHAPSGFFSALLTAEERAEQIREIDLNDPFFQTLEVEVSTTADFAALDVKTIVVDLAYAQVEGTVTFSPDDHDDEHFQAARAGDDLSYRYAVKYVFGDSEAVVGPTDTVQTEVRTTTTRALVIHPGEDLGVLQVYLEPGIVDWDLVDRVEATLVYDDPENHFHAERTYLVAANTARQTWTVRLADPAKRSYVLRATYHLKGGHALPVPDQTLEIAHLYLADPFVDRLPLIIDPQVDPAKVHRVLVELSYVDADNAFEVHKNIDLKGPDFASVDIDLPLIDGQKRSYTYQVRLVKVDGSSENQAPVTTDKLSIIVSEGGIHYDVEIVLLGTLQPLGVDGLEVDLRGEPPEGAVQEVINHIFLPNEPNRAKVRLLLRADQTPTFEYQTRVFRSNGDVVEGDWTSWDKATLPLSLARLLNG